LTSDKVMGVKIIHTADIHIGASFASFGVNARKKISAQRDVLVDIVDVVLSTESDLLIIAGDLFHRAFGVAESDISFVLSQIRRLSGMAKVVILPGSHDYYAPGSVLSVNRGKFESIPGCRIFAPDTEEICFEDVSICVRGRALTSNVSANNQLGNLNINPSYNYNIAVAHGSVASAMKPTENVDILIEVGEWLKDFDYVALGHWHSFREIDNPYVRTLYSGAPDPIARDEVGAGFIAIVTIDNAGVGVEKSRVGKTRIVELNIDCSDIKGTDGFVDKVKSEVSVDPFTILSIRPFGVLSIDAMVDFDVAKEILEESYLSVHYPEVSCQREIPHELIGEVPEGTVAGRYMRILLDRLNSAGNEEEKKIYSEALQLGFQLFRGKNPLR